MSPFISTKNVDIAFSQDGDTFYHVLPTYPNGYAYRKSACVATLQRAI